MHIMLPFKLERETKNTYRYMEVGEEDKQILKTIYIKKSALPTAPPKTVMVIITDEEV